MPSYTWYIGAVYRTVFHAYPQIYYPQWWLLWTVSPMVIKPSDTNRCLNGVRRKIYIYQPNDDVLQLSLLTVINKYISKRVGIFIPGYFPCLQQFIFSSPVYQVSIYCVDIQIYIRPCFACVDYELAFWQWRTINFRAILSTASIWTYVASLLLEDRVLLWTPILRHIKSNTLTHGKEDLYQSVYSNFIYPRSHDFTGNLPPEVWYKFLLENHPSET